MRSGGIIISPGKCFEFLSLQWYFLHLEGSILVFSTAAPGGTKCLIACRQSNVDFPSLGLHAYFSRGIARGTRMSLSCIIIKRNKANFANNPLQLSSLGKLTICRGNSSQKMAFLMIKICKK